MPCMGESAGLPILPRDEAAEFRDPVCGMAVIPERAAAVVEHNGRKFYFCSKNCAERFQHDPQRYLVSATQSPPTPALAEVERATSSGTHDTSDRERVYVPHAPGNPRIAARHMSKVRHGAGAGLLPGARREDTIRLPDAPADRPRPARFLPDLRHGAGTADGDRRGGGQSGTSRDDSPVLVQRGADRAAGRYRDGRHDSRQAARPAHEPVGCPVDSIRPGDSGRALGRLAVLRARLGVDRQSQLEHVHADRHRRRRGVRL